MGAPTLSTKRLAIDKANAQVVAAAGVAVFVVIFCLFATKAAVQQNQYISRVTDAKEKAHRQLQDNLSAYDQLKSSYAKFDQADPNILGGSRAGTDKKGGTNSKLVLDALPSAYDFPALAASIEKILTDGGMTISSVTGTDDQLSQESNTTSPKPEPVAMPFSFTISNADFAVGTKLSQILESSIRPIQVDKITISGADITGKGSITIEAHTYYQPAKNADITKKVQK